jgi:hypothetical protein
MPWSSRWLLASAFYTPLILWAVFWTETGYGHRQLPLAAKFAVLAAIALWHSFLLVARARHQRRMRAVLAKLQEDDVPASPRVRIAQEVCYAPAAEATDDDASDHAPEDHVKRKSK